MSKRTILFLSLGAILLGIVGAVVFAVGIGAAANCAGPGATTITQECLAQGTTPTYIAFALFGLAALLGLIGWIGGLIKTATIGAWGWFVAVLILGSLGALIYGIAGPETRAAPAAY